MRVLEAAPETTIPDLRAMAFAAATGRSVAVIEDHVIVPEGWAAPGEAPPPPMRFVCVEFDDGSGMAGSIDPNWQMPSLLSGGEAEPDEGPPLATIGMVGLLLAGVVISILAFRRP